MSAHTMARDEEGKGWEGSGARGPGRTDHMEEEEEDVEGGINQSSREDGDEAFKI